MAYSQIFNNPNAPFINQLARSSNYATNYFAVGHPSSTNYLEIVGGSNFGVRSDDYPNWHNSTCMPNLISGVTTFDSPASVPPLICPIYGTGTDAETPALDCTNEVSAPPCLWDIDGVQQPRLPAGWKRHRDTVYCDRCWRGRYLLRAISMPVASPEEISWEDLRKLLKAVWAETTRASNWMTTELYASDVRREPGLEKLPPMARVYFYPKARKKFPSLPAQTVSSLEQSVQKKYRARRYEVLWTAGASLPNHRYPTPFPVHNQSWSAALVKDRPMVSVRLGDGRVQLRLKSGPQFHRQMQSFLAIVRSEAVTGELALYQQGSALMVKMVAWLPRPAGARGSNRNSAGADRYRESADCRECQGRNLVVLQRRPLAPLGCRTPPPAAALGRGRQVREPAGS